MVVVMISHIIEADMNRLSKKILWTYIARNANDELDIILEPVWTFL